jgi:hypothetical protein
MSQMETKRSRGLTGWVLASIFLCACVSLPLMGGCYFLADEFALLSPVPATPPEEMLLPTLVLPPDWYAETESTYITAKVVSTIFNGYYDGSVRFYDYPDRVRPEWTNVESALHAVARYRSPTLARRNYLQQLEMSFRAHDQWHNPLAEQLLDVRADEHRFACPLIAKTDPGEQVVRCTYIARYGSYVTLLWIIVDPPHMTYDGILRVLQAIDEKFTSLS